MKHGHYRRIRLSGACGVLALTLAACATPRTPESVTAVRADLARLEADTVLAPLAPQALRDAEAAVQLAEQTGVPGEVTAHRVYVAQRKIEIAQAVAEARHADAERANIVAERDQARLDARTQEAQVAKNQAATASAVAAGAEQKAADLQRQLNELQAQQTDRGLMMTLGDVLFATGQAELKPGSVAKLDQLVTFMRNYPDRTVTIEGHTDNVGSESFNIDLSQRRADAVRGYLVRQGVDGSRVKSTGMGEDMPVATNNTEAGRQQNRRVEIIISNPTPTAAASPG
jgi:outer membrane protein OmpA-like peptidoglycan-associated protein